MRVVFDIEGADLGESYSDKATGFTGTAVGVWLSDGGVQVSLARLGSDGATHSEWFACERLEPACSPSGPGFGRSGP